jgi:hypothetical protein
VKKHSRILAFPALLAFGFILSISGLTSKFNVKQSAHIISAAGIASESFSTSSLPLTAQSENVISVFHLLPHSSKNEFKNQAGHVRSLEKLLCTAVSSYILYFNKISHRFESTDIIFPFHYFW